MNCKCFLVKDIWYRKSVFYISKLDYKTNYEEDKSKFLEDLATDINNKKKI